MVFVREKLLKSPELKKYGLRRFDFKTKEPNLRAPDSSHAAKKAVLNGGSDDGAIAE